MLFVLGIAIGEIESVYEECDVKQRSKQLKFCLRVQFFLSNYTADMIYRTYHEERSFKVKRRLQMQKFGRKHFNFKQEREAQQKQENLLNEMLRMQSDMNARIDSIVHKTILE